MLELAHQTWPKSLNFEGAKHEVRMREREIMR